MRTIKKRIIAFCSAKGSKAKTTKGQIRFCLKNKEEYRKELLKHYRYSLFSQNYALFDNLVRRELLTAKQKKKLRIQADNKYRKKELRKLNRKLRKVPSTLADFNYNYIQKRKKLFKQKRELFSINRAYSLFPNEFCIIKGIRTSDKIDHRYSSYTVESSVRNSVSTEDMDSYRYKSNGYTFSHTPQHQNIEVRSVAHLLDSQQLEYDIKGEKGIIVIPKPYKFQIDDLGVKIVKGHDDYHLSYLDIISFNFSNIENKFSKLKAKRKETELLKIAEDSNYKDLYLCFADSVNAGNCETGTINYCKKHNLNIKQHYPASDIIALNDNVSRVHLAVKLAILRQYRDEKRGYCQL